MKNIFGKSEDIHKAFLETNYWVFAKPKFLIRVNELFPQTANVDTWAFITAWNPLSQKLALEENRERNIALVNDIIKLGLKYSEGLGISSDNTWQEESYFIENIDLKSAFELAKKYNQMAFLFGKNKGKAELIYCN